MLKKIIYSALLFVFGTAMAQPGFMGKKNWVEGNLLFFSALRNPTATRALDDGFYKNIFHLNKTLALSYYRVLDRKRAIGFEYNYDLTGFYWQPQSEGHTVNIYKDKGEVPDLKIKTNTLGVSYLKYANQPGNIAPLGFYTEWELLYSNSIIYDSKFDDNIDSFTLGYVGFGLGVRSIIAKKITYNLGVKSRLSSHLLTIFEPKDPDNNDIIKSAKGRVTSKQAFNITIGLGYIF
jgi:hypothetical protein